MCRVLYISSCHPTLEADDLKLMDRTGAEVFSTGIYLDPGNPLNIPHLMLREDSLGIKHNPQLREEFLRDNPNFASRYRGLDYPKPRLSKSFIDKFDIVVVVYVDAMVDHWDNLKHKPTIVKTCGNTHSTEKNLKTYADQGVIFVRGSKNELKIPHSNGGRVIRITVDPDYFTGWEGSEKSLLAFHSHFKARKSLEPVKRFLKVRESFKDCTKIYGAYAPGHKDPLVIKTLNPREQLEQYQKCAVYFNISTPGAPITYNFIEAMCVGIPVVTFDVEVSSSLTISRGHPPMCEVPEILQNGKNGFFSDNVEDLKLYIKQLIEDRDLAERISKEGRKTVTEIFSIEKSTHEWKQLFNELGAGL